MRRPKEGNWFDGVVEAYARHIEYAGKWLFSEICEQDLEGIVRKWRDGIYREYGDDWLKIRNQKYSQAEGRHELMDRRRSHLALHKNQKPQAGG